MLSQKSCILSILKIITADLLITVHNNRTICKDGTNHPILNQYRYSSLQCCESWWLFTFGNYYLASYPGSGKYLPSKIITTILKSVWFRKAQDCCFWWTMMVLSVVMRSQNSCVNTSLCVMHKHVLQYNENVSIFFFSSQKVACIVLILQHLYQLHTKYYCTF